MFFNSRLVATGPAGDDGSGELKLRQLRRMA
jgi:hypothetical protein